MSTLRFHRTSVPLLAAVMVSAVAAVAQDTGTDAAPRPQAESLVLDVGRSKVVKADWPVKRVSVANPKVADVQILTPTEVLIVGNEVGVTDLYLWSENGQVREAVVRVELNLSQLEQEIKGYFPTADVALGKSGDVVVARGIMRRAEDVKNLESILKSALNDPEGRKWVNMTSLAGVQQVLVKVRVAEANRNAVRSLGFDLKYNGKDFFGTSRPSSLLGPPDIERVNGGIESVTQSISPATTLFGFFPQADLDVAVQALIENQYLRILAEPSLVALSGEEASFLAGGEFPVPVVQGSSGGAGGGTSITIEFKEFGVRLSFRPTVLGDGRIRLRVAPEVSELSDQGSVEIEGFRVPAIRTRRAETTLEMNSGQSFVMAGLLNRDVAARAGKVPGVGQLPVLGALFRSVRYERGETELVVLATVELVEPLSVVHTGPLPGDSHVEPSDWELYADGRVQGRTPAPISASQARAVREMGFDDLQGPGAWARHGMPADQTVGR